MMVCCGRDVAADTLDEQIVQLLKSKCVMCHDDLKAGAGGGVDNLLRLDELASGYTDADVPTDSALLDLIMGESPSMPKKRMKDVTWNGPLSEAELEQFEKWIKRGGPSKDYLEQKQGRIRELISEQQIAAAIVDELSGLTGAELDNARVLTLCNLHNNRSISDADLEIYRAAIVKTLNSLSRMTDVLGLDTSDAVNKLVAIDEARTMFRFDLRHIGWTKSDWNRVARHYPYALVQRSGLDRTLSSITSTSLPQLRADWFVFAVLQPPLYHDLVEIPQTLDQLEDNLGINRIHEIQNQKVARAAMERSLVSVNNRMVERIPMTRRAGAYHISYDFASNDRQQNLLDNPLGPEGVFTTNLAFRHDGGEVIFNLPNGYQAYALVTADGARLNTAPSDIVFDATMPGGKIINGISCLSCHYQGMKPESGSDRLARLDEVRETALKDFERFSGADRELVAALYPEHTKFEALLEQDRRRFLRALERSGIPQKNADEPARALFDQFVRDLDLDAVAAEFGLSPDALTEQMNRDNETRRLLQRIARGTLKRQLYLTAFQRIARLIGAGDVRSFEKLPFPYFGEQVDNAAAPPANGPLRIGNTGVDLIDAEHRTGRLRVTLRTADERRSYKDGEAIVAHVRATQDCFLTIVSVDSEGEITLLLPNDWEPEAKLKAGQTAQMPSKEMGFQFFATEPHGPTILKAIATRRPLNLKGVNRQVLRAKGFARLGNTKAIGVRPRNKVGGNGDVRPQANAILTDDTLDEMFRPDEWATATWSLVTRPAH